VIGVFGFLSSFSASKRNQNQQTYGEKINKIKQNKYKETILLKHYNLQIIKKKRKEIWRRLERRVLYKWSLTANYKLEMSMQKSNSLF
jgi:hypothetical protein